jgi:tetratricopeptide (TPR) repeat protein
MNRKKSADSKKGLSLPVLIISGITAAFFLLITVIIILRLSTHWSPSVKNAEHLLRKKKYTEALAIVEKAGNGQEKNVPLLVEKGKIWLFLALEKENRSRWKNYGNDDMNWLKSTEADKAEHFLKKAIKRDPHCKDAHFFLGRLYMEKGWFSTAETEFLSVLHADKEHVGARKNLGVLYTEINRYDLAEKELKTAFQLDPESPSIAKNLSWLYRFYLNKPDSAIVWANRYLNLDPQNDVDIGFVRKELNEMLQRYPEYYPDEPMEWKKKRIKGRGLKKFQAQDSE